MKKFELVKILESTEEELFKTKQQLHNKIDQLDKSYERIEILNQTLTQIFPISKFFSDVLDIWNNQYNAKKDYEGSPNRQGVSLANKLDKFEEVMKSTQEVVDLGLLKTDDLEQLIKENTNLPRHTITPRDSSGKKGNEDICKDVDEHYIGSSSALLQAENILNSIDHAKPISIEVEKQGKIKQEKLESRKNSPQNSFQTLDDPYSKVGKMTKNIKRKKSYSYLDNLGTPSRRSESSFKDSASLSNIPLHLSTTIKQDFTQLESIAEKDFEEKEEFKTKWARYVNLVKEALRDRRYKELSLKAIKKSFPKPIDFLKIKIYEADLSYEHQIISRFEDSILKNFITLFENKETLENDIQILRKEIENQNTKIEALREAEESLGRVNSFVEEIS